MISGLVIGSETFRGAGTYYAWSFILPYWFSGIAIAVVFVALAEIIEQLQKLNSQGEDKFAFSETDSQQVLDEKLKEDGTSASPTKDYTVSWIVAICLLIVFILLAITSM